MERRMPDLPGKGLPDFSCKIALSSIKINQFYLLNSAPNPLFTAFYASSNDKERKFSY
jgi:hypothetical protein